MAEGLPVQTHLTWTLLNTLPNSLLMPSVGNPQRGLDLARHWLRLHSIRSLGCLLRGRTNVVGGGRLVGEELAAASGAAARGNGRAADRGAVPAAAVHEAVAGHVEVGAVLAAGHHVVLLRLLHLSTRPKHHPWRQTLWQSIALQCGHCPPWSL